VSNVWSDLAVSVVWSVRAVSEVRSVRADPTVLLVLAVSPPDPSGGSCALPTPPSASTAGFISGCAPISSGLIFGFFVFKDALFFCVGCALFLGDFFADFAIGARYNKTIAVASADGEKAGCRGAVLAKYSTFSLSVEVQAGTKNSSYKAPLFRARAPPARGGAADH
jgi:hypothetical protein